MQLPRPVEPGRVAGKGILRILLSDFAGVQAQARGVGRFSACFLRLKELGHPLVARCADAASGMVPETHRFRSSIHTAIDQRNQADPIQRRLVHHPHACDFKKRGIDVRCIAGHIGCPWIRNARRPLKDSRDTKAAFVNLALVSTSARRTNSGKASVVAAIPEDSVFINAEVPQFSAKLAEGAVHACNLAVEMLLLVRLVGVECAVFFDRLVRSVRRAEPDYRQEWL